MNRFIRQHRENTHRAGAERAATGPTFVPQFRLHPDHRLETGTPRSLGDMLNRGIGVETQRRWQQSLNQRPQVVAQRRLAAVLSGRADGPTIQRVVVRGGGNRQRNVDLVNTVIGFRDFGITPGRINVEEFPGGNPAAAIVGPQLQATPTAGGQTAVRVAHESINVVDYRMELPAAPPWTRNMAKGAAIPYVEMVAGSGYAARLNTLRQSATDPTTLRIAGAPNDAAFAALVETHENQHVADLWTTTAQILEPWDANIKRMHEADAPMVAADEPTARATLYAAVGGTPAQIGQRMADDMRARGLAFHQTAAGGPPLVANVTTATNPNRLTLTWRHPLG